jgi:P4 family phage/plasmid primase-like protien
VLETLEKDMARKPTLKKPDKKAANINGGADNDTVWDIICKLRKQKNGEKFSKLYDRGDFSDYGSRSEADLALCSMLAFRIGDNPELIDSLFRDSALYREKWERDDYREETIRKAIDGCNGNFYTERQHPPFIRFNDKGQPSVSVPLLVKYIEENVRFLLVRDNGKQSLMKYVYEGGVYKLYSDDMFRGLIREIIADYDIELVKMRTINEAFSLIMTSLKSIPHSVLNRDESVINFQNGLLHIGETLELTEHSPDVLTTIQIPCDWTDEALETPVFDSYLETLTNGDDNTKTLLLEFIGACVSNIRGWRLKKSLFMVGAGDTGKSQLKSLVERLLGKGNFIGIDLSEIEARFGTGAIYGTRLAGSSDMSFMTVGELKTFKKITGGDSLFAEFKGQQAFEYTYNGLLWFCMNRLPKFGGDDGKWVYDRIMVVNCPNVIPNDKQDKRLLDKMYRERQGIIYKAINALLNVIKNDFRFTESESITQAREDYMTDNNTAIAFFNECMRPWVRGKIQKHCTTGRVYKVYQAWCRENNNGYAKTAKEFREELSAYLGAAFADLTVVRNGYKYYKDYGLTLEAKELYASVYGYDEDEFLSD